MQLRKFAIESFENAILHFRRLRFLVVVAGDAKSRAEIRFKTKFGQTWFIIISRNYSWCSLKF